MEMIGAGILLLVGLVAGLIASSFIYEPKSIGSIRVDRSDDEPYLFLELDEPLDKSIVDGEYVTFKVFVKDYISQK